MLEVVRCKISNVDEPAPVVRYLNNSLPAVEVKYNCIFLQTHKRILQPMSPPLRSYLKQTMENSGIFSFLVKNASRILGCTM